MAGGGQGRPRNAKADVHSSRLTVDGRAVDAESRLVPQTQTNEQHKW